MTPSERFEFVNRVIQEALDVPESHREAVVFERCGAATDLTAEAMELLALTPSIHGLTELCAGARADIGPGTILGERFRIVEEIGAGGAGVVYLADDRYFGPVALKIVHSPLNNGAMRERLAAEVGAARSVRHPNVCPVFDLHTFNGERSGSISAFTMKYLAGETLAAKLARAPLTGHEFLQIARGIASGIDALHAAGIVHCDLKPGNVVLTAGDGGPAPVIVDFGLAISSGGAPAERVAGSPQYMAPEQFRRQHLSTAADIYAFGLVLYEMAAGARPFPDEDLMAAAIRRNLEDAPRLSDAMPGAPRGWGAAIAGALRRDPAQRPRSAGEVVDMMNEIAPARASSAPVRLNLGCRHMGRHLARRGAVAHKRSHL